MDWLTAVWNKINKPLHFLLTGGALALFAPPDLSWAGYVFIAAGLAGAVECIYKKICVLWESHGKINRIKNSLTTLNASEKAVLLGQVQKGEQTFYLHYDDYHGLRTRRFGGEYEYRRLVGTCTGLCYKNFMTASAEHTITNFQISDQVWLLLQAEYKKNPRFLSSIPTDGHAMAEDKDVA